LYHIADWDARKNRSTKQMVLRFTIRHIGIYLSTAINTALHGEPSAPDKFSGAALKK